MEQSPESHNEYSDESTANPLELGGSPIGFARNSIPAEIFKSTQHRFVRFFLTLFPLLVTGIVACYCYDMLKDGMPDLQAIASMSFSMLVVLLLWKIIQKQKNIYYSIDEDFLYFQGSLNGNKIALSDIRAVYSDYMPTGGKRPALNTKGLIVNYGEGYQLFISPEEESRFIKTLQQYNPRIIFDVKTGAE